MQYIYKGISLSYEEGKKEYELVKGKKYTLTLVNSDTKGNITFKVRGGGQMTQSVDLFNKNWKDV